MQKLLFLPIVTIFLMITGCHNTKYAAGNTGGSEALYQHQWNLEELNGQPVEQGSMRKPAYLLFAPGQVNSVSGNTGCNNFKGSFELTGTNSIKFLPLATTKMACPGENIESKFLEAMGKANNWSITDDQLMLNDGNTLLAKFRAAPAGSTSSAGIPAALLGTWELNYISGKRIAFEGLYPDKKPQLVFADTAANAIAGHTSCNAFKSKLTLDGNKINIAEPIAMTMMACPGEGEKTFLDMLKKVNKFAISEHTLTFMLDDVAVMRFAKK